MSNLLQKASIITTPTAYDTGKILSVKPVQYYGPELVTNGDFATDSNWTKGTGITISGGSANFTGVANDNIRQDIGLITGKTYKIVFTVSNYVSGDIDYNVGGNTRQGAIAANGTYTDYVVSDSGSFLYFQADQSSGFTGSIDNVSVKEVFNADFDFTRNSSATRVGSNGLIQDVASNLPRIDYTGGVGSWKFEPQRTNSVTYSEDFSQWQQSGVTITPNSAISPDGTLNADKIIATTTDPAPFIFANVTATEHTFSFYYKGEGNSIGKQARVLFWFIGTATGTTTSVNFIVTGDWQRFENQITPTGAGTLALRIDFPADLGAVGDYGYLWGAQLEQGSYATSYIPTSGSATTRLADAANNAGSSDLISSTEGVLYAEISALANDGSGRKVTLNNGSNSQVLVLEYTSTSNQIRVFLSNGSLQFNEYITISDLTEFNKIAIKYKVNDFAIWVNGIELATDTSGTTFSSGTLTNVNFDDGSGNADFYGNTKCVAVFKEALTDLELECLVSWMSFSDLGINFGYTVE